MNKITMPEIQAISTVVPCPVFTELTLFVCTYVAKLENIKIPVESLIELLCNNLFGGILAINSNYGHGAQPGYEHFIKKPKKHNLKAFIKNRIRKIQGDGTCFNSAVEPVIQINHTINPVTKKEKVYFIKCFPTTGETQIPGVINNDYSDGHTVLVTFINHLNSLNVGIDGKQIYIKSEGPKMVNFKFRLVRDNPRILINLYLLAKFLQFLEKNKNDTVYKQEEWTIIPPPFVIKETKYPIDDIKVSFRINTETKRSPRINIFQEGKVNILGADTRESAEKIYEYLSKLFENNWHVLISIKPEKDQPVNHVLDTYSSDK